MPDPSVTRAETLAVLATRLRALSVRLDRQVAIAAAVRDVPADARLAYLFRVLADLARHLDALEQPAPGAEIPTA